MDIICKYPMNLPLCPPKYNKRTWLYFWMHARYIVLDISKYTPKQFFINIIHMDSSRDLIYFHEQATPRLHTCHHVMLSLHVQVFTMHLLVFCACPCYQILTNHSAFPSTIGSRAVNLNHMIITVGMYQTITIFI